MTILKKIILLQAIVLLMFTNLFAQTDSREQFVAGLKIGTNYSNVYDAEGEEFDADPKFGWVTGAFFSIPVGAYLGVQPEILFSQKGFNATGRLLGETYEFTRTTNYIDVPIYFALKPSSSVSILAGPQYSYLIKQRDVFTNNGSSLVQEEEFENDNIRKNIFCFSGGLDINVNHIVLGTRVGWDITRNNGDGTSATPRYKNVWYQATLGYRFYN